MMMRRYLALFSILCFAQTADLKDLDARGKALIAKADYKGAQELYNSGLEQARTQKDQGWEAEFLRATGEIFQRQRQWKESLPPYEASLAIRKSRGDRPEIAYMLTGIGLVHLTLRNDAEAERYLEQGRAAYSELGNKVDEARAAELLAQLKIRQKKLTEAERLLTSAMATLDPLHDDAGSIRLRLELADVYRGRSDYGAALQKGFEALEIQRRSKIMAVLPAIFESLGTAFLETEQTEKARAYFQQCLEIRIKAKDPQAISQAYNNLGYALEKLGRHQEALDALTKALELRRSGGNAALVVQTLINLGNTQHSLGNTVDAAASFEDARKNSDGKFPPQFATSLYGLGNLALEAGRIEEAIDDHTRALKIRQDTGDRIGAVHTMNRLALASEMKGDLVASEKWHATALDEFEKIAAGIADPAQVGRFRVSTIILYPHYARVLLKEGKIEAAFAIAERSRGAGLARMSQVNRKGFVESLKDSDRDAWAAAAAERARATNRLRDALADSSSAASLEGARVSYLAADNALEQLRDRIYASDPNLAGQAPRRPDLQKVIASSKATPGTVYLEWLMVDPSSTLLFALSDGKLRGFDIPVGSAQLAQMADRWRATFAQGVVRGVIAANRAADPKSEEQSARQLFGAVFGPVAPELDKKTWKRIGLVPDGPLLDLPFAALEGSNGARLIENYALTSAVSIESLFSSDTTRKQTAGLLAIGDPFESATPRIVAPDGERYAPLAHARAEAQSVAALFPKSVVLTGGEAQEARVKQDLRNYRIIHFATHGILSRTDGLQSGLLLANEAPDSKEDGLLQAWEIADAPLSAELAVLSACQTAEGDERLGEGLMGLAWAFQAAGCPNVVASLWNIDDEATQRVMTEFYKSIRAGARVDDAMRSAMVSVKKAPGNASPYYWAGFRVIGAAGQLK
jgi:CHAT domain-containing protein/tetratricopeptide (TPR) repeat protein